MNIPRFINPMIYLGVLLGLVLLMAACGGDEEPTPAPEVPTPTTAPTNTPAVEPTEVSAEATESPVATPEAAREIEESPLATPEERQVEEPSPLATPEEGGEAMSDLDRLVERAKEQLSEETGVDVADIDFIESEEVEWPDASLGCPEPGMMYAQVITPGYHIVLEADGEEYEYHTSLDPEGRVVSCE